MKTLTLSLSALAIAGGLTLAAPDVQAQTAARVESQTRPNFGLLLDPPTRQSRPRQQRRWSHTASISAAATPNRSRSAWTATIRPCSSASAKASAPVAPTANTCSLPTRNTPARSSIRRSCARGVTRSPAGRGG